MIRENINKIIENNLLLSGVVAIICTIIFYFENKRAKHKYENTSYIKLIILIALSIFVVLFIKNKKMPIPECNVKIGEPDF
jgi:hypothetical protein